MKEDPFDSMAEIFDWSRDEIDEMAQVAFGRDEAAETTPSDD